jgi:beta-galactosidase
VSKTLATIEVKTRITNSRKNGSQCTLATSILDKDGNTVATQEASGEVEANGEYEFVQQLVVDKPSLWSSADSYLYKVRSTTLEASQVINAYDTPVGIREAVFDANQGFLLNGERIKLNGGAFTRKRSA